MSDIIGEGFMYTVSDKNDGTVEKIPRKADNTSVENEKFSLELHKRYLGDLIVPDTDIFIPKRKIITSSNNFEIHQNKIISGNPVDLVNTTNEKVIELLEGGNDMQKDNNVLFDIFGMEGMVKLFNHYFKGTPIKSFNDFFLPANAKYLKLMHNFPEKLLLNLNNMEGNPLLAYNILEDEKGNIHFIDTDHRPLDIFHPLNMIGNWITKKALKDISKVKSSNIINNKSHIENISLSKEKPPLGYMLKMLQNNNHELLKKYINIYTKRKDKEKYPTFDEFLYTQYGQIGISKSVDEQSKKDDGEYYFRLKYINSDGKEIYGDIYNEKGNIYEYCKKNNITDLEFQGWGFNLD